MTVHPTWSGTEALPLGQALLLEASAGTGKTWQIEGLVVRLLAEYEVPIERLLVLTFTNAATAELRRRVRERLVAARKVLAGEEEAGGDAILANLAGQPDMLARRLRLVEAALSAFDQAAIWTIHGFSQRMLQQLAFESGQEPQLELVSTVQPILDELVDDELARTFAQATTAELSLLKGCGWCRKKLQNLAKEVVRGMGPEMVPEGPDGSAELSALDGVRTWMGAATALRGWLDGAEGRSAVEALREEAGRRTKSKARKGEAFKRLNGFANADKVDEAVAKLAGWLAGGAGRAARLASPILAVVKNLSLSHQVAKWPVDGGSLESFGGYPLLARVQEFKELQDRCAAQPLVGFAARVRPAVDARLRLRRQLSFDAMLTRLAEQVEFQGPEGPLATAIRSRFDAALVDEFQDTDAAQWAVLRAVFAHPMKRLLMVGDPKQAIYGFRGADIFVYGAAAATASVATMRVNHRSDPPLLQAMNTLWGEGSDAFLVGEGFDYVDVTPGDRNADIGISDLPAVDGRARRALEVRWVDGQATGLETHHISLKTMAEQLLADLCAAEVARLLESQAQLTGRADSGGPRLIEPGDIAVLVRTNKEAECVRGALSERGVPSVTGGGGSVYQSAAAAWICRWLDALASPGRESPARALVLTPLFGWTTAQLARELDGAARRAKGESCNEGEEWGRWLRHIQTWAERWPVQGFARVLERALDDHGVMPRLLGAPSGERDATDLRHLLELCHAEERRTRMGPAALAAWLRARRADANNNPEDDEARRLESDARAVRIVTMHKSKGLQYPVVLLPFCSSPDRKPKANDIALYHRETDAAEVPPKVLALYPSVTKEEWQAQQAAQREARQEAARLIYVAMTRAAHHCVIWLGSLGSDAVDMGNTALGRLMLRARDDQGLLLSGPNKMPTFKKPPKTGGKNAEPVPDDWEDVPLANVQSRLNALAASSQGTLGWSAAKPPGTPALATLRRPEEASVRPRSWPAERKLVGAWQVTSYSSLVRSRTFDDEEPEREDERALATARAQLEEEDVDAPEQVTSPELDARMGSEAAGAAPSSATLEGLDSPCLLAEMRGGAEIGTWVHEILEHLDFQTGEARDGRTAKEFVEERGRRAGVQPVDQTHLIRALPSILQTPLGGGDPVLPDDFSLSKLAPGDRIDELPFDLGIGAGSAWEYSPEARHGQVDPEAVRAALKARAGEDWGGAPWLAAVSAREKVFPAIAGILTGFVDLLWRLPTSRGDYRYYVTDYKTNRIAAHGDRRSSRRQHYTPAWMAWEMSHHGYHLQALLYTLAVHRMLCQRLGSAYSYSDHMGGHLYLFVRGMEGTDTPRVEGQCLGVYHDRWPEQVVVGLDRALSGASVSDVRMAMAAVREGGK